MRALLALLLVLAMPAAAQAPTPFAARIELASGSAAARGPGAPGWSGLQQGAVLPAGTALRTGPGGRLVAALPGTLVALDSGGALDLARLETTASQLILNSGTLALVVTQLPGAALQVATPRGVAELRTPGRYLVEAGDAIRPTRLSVFTGSARLATTAGTVPTEAGQATFVPPEGLARLGPAGPQAALVGWLAGESPEPGSIVRPNAPPEAPRPAPSVVLETQVLVPYPVFIPVHPHAWPRPPQGPGGWPHGPAAVQPPQTSFVPPPFSGGPLPPLVAPAPPPVLPPAAALPMPAPRPALPPVGQPAPGIRGTATLPGPQR
ncbi:hypothetical protein [Falsiroseomonas oryziterrae]|uniref:hypothetical protein n=1 Tax=Falsiroseomonas oryziterrae TaxID=2911368 RepID=UPI001F3E6D8F|nr:hypothetical protein [Roseomonas sp. NPKOSM-4]